MSKHKHNLALTQLYKKHVKGTPEKSIIANKTIFLCHLTKAVTEGLDLPENKVYINTKALKHMYDKKPAEEFDFLLEHLHEITAYPNHVYKNKDPKRGDFCFVKQIEQHKYLSAVEVAQKSEKVKIFIATAFRLRKENYLSSYNLLWSWRGDSPSS